MGLEYKYIPHADCDAIYPLGCFTYTDGAGVTRFGYRPDSTCTTGNVNEALKGDSTLGHGQFRRYCKNPTWYSSKST